MLFGGKDTDLEKAYLFFFISLAQNSQIYAKDITH